MCLTCRLIQQEITPPGGVIYQTNCLILHQCLDSNIPGYLILSPIRHLTNYQDLTAAELTAIQATLQRSAKILQELPGVEKVYICSLGEETTHFHFHIFPRYRWMLDCPSESIYSGDKVDGAKLFSFMRIQYKTSTAMLSDQVIAAVDYIRNQLITIVP
jgi:diadenosine tetraphosphate (Ap4A) HIT family hydrolase